MEFVGYGEVWNELRPRGVVEQRHDESELELALEPALHATTIEFGGSAGGARPGIVFVDVPADRLAETLEAVLHKLHLAPVYLIPVAHWRNIFDIVAFGMAKNAQWQEIDSQACVELNTRDPLVCDARDLHTLRELLRVLLADGEVGEAGATQSVMVVATGQLLVAKITPKRPARILVGSAQVAQQLCDAANHFLGRR